MKKRKKEILTEMINLTEKIELNNLKRDFNPLVSIMTRTDFILDAINKSGMSKSKIESSSNTYFSTIDGIRGYYQQKIDKEIAVQYPKPTKELSENQYSRYIKRIYQLSQLYSSLAEAETFLDNLSLQIRENRVFLTYHFDNFKLMGFYRDTPFFSMINPEISPPQISSTYKSLVENAFQRNEWNELINAFKSDNINLFHNVPSLKQYQNLFSHRSMSIYNLHRDLLAMFYLISNMIRLHLEEINKTSFSTEKIHKLFICSDSELISYLTTLSDDPISEKDLASLIRFQERFRDNTLIPFSPFFRVKIIDGESKWILLHTFFITFYGKIWDNFIELTLYDNRKKGSVFEREISELFLDEGFVVWDILQLTKFQNTIKNQGSGDIDVIVQENEVVLLIQAKSVYYNRKTFQTHLRKGREQLEAANETISKNRLDFVKEFGFKKSYSYIVTPIAMPYRFTKDTSVEVISFNMLKEAIFNCKGNISIFQENLAKRIEQQRNLYYSQVPVTTYKSNNWRFTFEYQ